MDVTNDKRKEARRKERPNTKAEWKKKGRTEQTIQVQRMEEQKAEKKKEAKQTKKKAEDGKEKQDTKRKDKMPGCEEKTEYIIKRV